VGALTVDLVGSLGIVLAVVSMFAGVGVVGCIVGGGGIVVGVVGIGGRRAVSRIRPARMLAFSASKSMRCGGTVVGR